MAARKKEPKVSQYQKSLIATQAVKDFVPKNLLPLFNHMISLAKHSHSVGYPKRAGRELLHARKLATKPERWQVQKFYKHPTGKGGKWGNVGEVWNDRANADEYAARIKSSTIEGEKVRVRPA